MLKCFFNTFDIHKGYNKSERSNLKAIVRLCPESVETWLGGGQTLSEATVVSPLAFGDQKATGFADMQKVRVL